MSRDNVRALAVVAAGVLGAPSAAHAYCWQTTHDDDSCGADPGIELLWQGNCVSYSVSELGSQDLPMDQVLDVIHDSFDTWEEAAIPPGGACSYLQFQPTVLASCEDVGFRQNAGNMNLIVFRESGWVSEYNHAPAAMGLTTVLFDPGTGEILSADMELNGDNFRFTTDTVDVDADLANTVTHEAGHMIGFAHSTEAAATMFGTSTSGEVQKATLHDDDLQGICDHYPIAEDTGRCFDPKGGLDTRCLPADNGCCAVAVGMTSRNDGQSAVAVAVLLVAAFWRRRRRG